MVRRIAQHPGPSGLAETEGKTRWLGWKVQTRGEATIDNSGDLAISHYLEALTQLSPEFILYTEIK